MTINVGGWTRAVSGAGSNAQLQIPAWRMSVYCNSEMDVDVEQEHQIVMKWNECVDCTMIGKEWNISIRLGEVTEGLSWEALSSLSCGWFYRQRWF